MGSEEEANHYSVLVTSTTNLDLKGKIFWFPALETFGKVGLLSRSWRLPRRSWAPFSTSPIIQNRVGEEKQSRSETIARTNSAVRRPRVTSIAVEFIHDPRQPVILEASATKFIGWKLICRSLDASRIDPLLLPRLPRVLLHGECNNRSFRRRPEWIQYRATNLILPFYPRCRLD